MMEHSSSNHDIRDLLRALLLGFLVLSPVVFWHDLVEPFEAVKATFTQLTALAILVLTAGLVRTRGMVWAVAQFQALFAGPIGIATLLGLASAVVSTALSLSPRTSLQGARDSNMGLPTVLALTVLFAASRSVCRDWLTVRCLLQASVLGFALSFAYAAVQMLGYDPLPWSKTWDYHGWTRPSGTQGHPNYLAGHAVMVLPIVLGLLRQSRNVRNPSPFVACTILILMVVVTVLATLSRSCLVAGGIAATLVHLGTGARIPRRRMLLLLGSAFVVGVGVLTFTGQFAQALGQRIREIASSPGRWPIWEGAVQLFVERPWTGCGLDTFGLAWPRVRSEAYWEVEWGFMPGKAHNEFLHTLATQGILGAASLFLFWIALAWGLARACRRGRCDGVAVLGGIVVAFHIQNLVGFSVATTAGILAVVSGMIAAREDIREGESEPTAIASLLPGVAGLGVSVLLLVLWQGSFRPEIWRVALVGIVSSWAAVLVVLASPGDSRSAVGFESRGALSCRPFLLPACGGLILAWFLMSPLLASALSFQAECWLPTDPARAWALHERAVRLVPQTALLHERRARAAWQASARASNPDERSHLLKVAGNSVEHACRLEPRSARLQASRARIAFDLARGGLGEPEAVLLAFDRALELDGNDWLVVADAARAATTLGFHDDSARFLLPYIGRESCPGMIRAEQGTLELARGRTRSAEVLLRESLGGHWYGEEERFDQARLVLGMVLFESGQFRDALAEATEVLHRRPDWTPAWLLLARCRERQGLRQQAFEAYQHILDRHPGHEQARAGIERTKAPLEAVRM